MKHLLALPLVLVSAPAFAASKNPFSPDFYSLANTDFVVAIAFLIFIGILWYVGVHKMIFKGLDERAAGIKSDLDEAKALREEAQALLASYERKQKEVQEQADRIVAAAKDDAAAAAEQGKADIATSIERRIAAAKDQIASAEASAVKEVRDTAVSVAIAAAGEVLAKQTTAASANALIDDAIEEVGKKLH